VRKIHYQIILLSLAFFAVSLSTYSQKIFYGDKEFDIYSSNYRIVGKVKDNIIVWTTEKNFPSRMHLYIYDDEMRLINERKLNLLKPTRFFNTYFLNCKDSFQVIYQCNNNNHYLCKLISFDENGNVLHNTTIEKGKESLLSTIQNRNFYDVILSEDQKSFALAKSVVDSATNTLSISYRFFENNKDYSGTAVLPFNYSYTFLGNSMLINGELILRMTEFKNSFFNIGIFKIDLKNNTVVNSLRKLQSGYLINNTIVLSAYSNGYTICAVWQHQKSTGVFIWKLNNELADITADTVIEEDSGLHSLVTGLWVFNNNRLSNENKLGLFITSTDMDSVIHISNIDSIIPRLNNNDSENIYNYSAIESNLNYNPSLGGDIYSRPFNYVTTNQMPPEYYTRYFDNLHDFRNVNYPNTNNYLWGSNSMYNDHKPLVDLNNQNIYDQNKFWLSNKPEGAKLSFLGINEQNKVVDSLVFTGLIDSSVISNIEGAKIFTSVTGFNIIFPQLINDQQMLGHIKITPGNTYMYNQILLMQLKRTVLFNLGLQISNTAVVFPCIRENKMSFVKLVFN